MVDVEQASDASLVVAVGRWHQQALAEIYRRHGGAVHALARRILRSDTPAEEITQEVFLDLWNRPDKFDAQRGTLRSFLLARTHGKSVDFVRSEMARRKREERTSRETATSGYDIDHEVWDIAVADQVQEALGALPDELRLTCPYCCAEEGHGEFMTEQQKDRAMAAAGEYAQQLVAGKLDEMFSDLARKVNSRRGAIRIEYSGGSTRSVRPRPLPAIVEEAPIRERRCTKCGNRYAVFGEHIACPVCDPLPPRVVADDAPDAQDAALAVFDEVPDGVLAQLRAAGSLERIAAGALGSFVSILETFLKRTRDPL